MNVSKCVVFYNGEMQMPELQIIKLSDAFVGQKDQADVELQVHMYNINFGHNKKLMDQCRILGEYAEFVDVCRKQRGNGMDLQESLNTAVEECIRRGVLSEFLSIYRAEVLGMLLEEFDVEKYERSLRAEGHEEGERIGEKRGEQRGEQRGISRSNELTRILLDQGRVEDLKRAASDRDYQEGLFQEFHL